MSDSDEENYVQFGTPLDPLDEDNLPRKKAVTVQDQYAVDEYGRRRFHGAFTGGFSAGYFNSVGTRDGWKPQQFKSSRKKRVEEVIQRPQDFMDEEDTSEFGIAPTGIRATLDYADANQRGRKRERSRPINNGPIPGTPVLQDLLKPVSRERVGVKLLRKMGWKPGQGVGPRLTKKEKVKARQENEKTKIYGCYMPSQREKNETSESDVSDDEYSEMTFAPDDYEPYRVNPKDNYFGIGYSGLDKRPVLSGHINLFEPQTFSFQEKSNKFSIKGQAFGVGAFEAEDEDIYAREDMSRYDFTLGPEKKTKSRWTQDHTANFSMSGCLQGFVPAKNAIDRRKFFNPPELPKDFKPIHIVRKSRFFPPIEPHQHSASTQQNGRKNYGGQDLNAETRASILGEPPPPPTPLPSVPGKPQFETSKEQTVKESENPSSIASKIIVRTLNLHGKEQMAERQKLEEERKVTAANSSSWLGKLYTTSFVKGGIVGSGLNVEGSLQNLNEFKEKTSENTSIETDQQTLEIGCTTSGFSNLTSGSSSSDSAKTFFADSDKQRRFEQYLVFLKNGEIPKLASIQPLSMTEWDRDQESTEFEQAARLFKSSSSSSHYSLEKKIKSDSLKTCTIFSEPEGIADQMKEAAKMKMFGKLTRERTIWQPSSLLCKRFNVAEPRVGCAMVVTERKKKFSVFDSLDFSSGVSKFQTAANLGNEETEGSRIESCRRVEEKDLEENKTEKEKNFQASYEKVFGKDVEEKKSGELESTTKMETSQDLESGENSSLKVETKSQVEEKKKDLFKAIFLDSSEDSDSEPEESVDSEIVKSVLIGKTPAEINVERNTSPPRGIFAKLDLDSLIAPVAATAVAAAAVAAAVASPSDENKKESEASFLKAESEQVFTQVEPEIVCEQVLPPDMYGPLPPSREYSKTRNTLNEETQHTLKPIFKSVVVPKTGGDKNKIVGEWVERIKVKKSKKEKKKHKHKDKTKERSKHKKSKKEKR